MLVIQIQLLYDPDGTIADIGLNYYHQGDIGDISAPIADFSCVICFG